MELPPEIAGRHDQAAGAFINVQRVHLARFLRQEDSGL